MEKRYSSGMLKLARYMHLLQQWRALAAVRQRTSADVTLDPHA